jgi:hypothetical protein
VRKGGGWEGVRRGTRWGREVVFLLYYWEKRGIGFFDTRESVDEAFGVMVMLVCTLRRGEGG